MEGLKNSKNTVDVSSIDFMKLYGITEGPFFIYNKLTKKYYEHIYRRNGIEVHCPAKFTFSGETIEEDKDIKFIYNNTKLVFDKFDENDIRTQEELNMICQHILIITRHDFLISEILGHHNNTFSIVYNLDKDMFKQHSYIQYYDENNDEKTTLDEIVRSCCQIYNIFPGREFYMYDIENKKYSSVLLRRSCDAMSIHPLKFIYEAGKVRIIYPEIHCNDYEYNKYVIEPFKNIYRDFFIDKCGTTRYKLMRAETIPESDIKNYTFFNSTIKEKETDVTPEVSLNPIESILKENNIQQEEDGDYEDFLILFQNNDILFRYEDYNIIFDKFIYSKDHGLICTTASHNHYSDESLKTLETMLVSGEAVPVDAKTWINKIFEDGGYTLQMKAFHLNQFE